jgi:hypothetical protein
VLRRKPICARLLSALVVGFSFLIAVAGPSFAHIAILVEIVEPQTGATVSPNTEARVFGRPMLFGVSEAPVRLSLDGRPLDIETGAPTSRPRPAVIRAGQTLRIPLRGLSPGQHELTVTYRPDRHAQLRRQSVSFIVREPATSRGVVAASIAAGTIAVLGI